MKNVELKRIDEIIQNFGSAGRNIFGILRAVQEEYNYIPKESIPYLAKKMGITESAICDIAKNYGFSLEPRGRYVIKVCDGTRCHVMKSREILDILRRELGLSDTKTTTDDLEFTLETVYCLGACSHAPSISVNGRIFSSVTPETAVKILFELRENS